MKQWSVARTFLAAGAVVIGIQAVLLATGNSAVLRGTLLDPDCYMHLSRALRLLTEGHWHDTIDPRINAPYGYAIHWTGLFDLLLAAGAAPLTWLGLEPHRALYLWGSAISPVLLVAALAVFAWGTRTRPPGAVFLWLTVLLFTQPQLAGSFIAGRPDHHSLVLGLLMAQLAWAYALFDGRTGPRAAVMAGVLAGIQLATSVEALLTIFFLMAGIVAVWLFFGRRHLKELVLYLAACVVTVLAWLLWERGQYLITPSYERVSVVHLVALSCALAAIAALAVLEARGKLRNNKEKWAAAFGLVGLAAAVTAMVFPDFFLGPWPHLDPVIVAWHKEIGELQPLLPTKPDHIAGFFAQMTAPILSLPLIISGLRRREPVMLLSLIGFVIFGALAMAQMRWSGEVQAVMLLPWTLTTVAIMKSTLALSWRGIQIPLRAFGLSGALLLQMVPSAVAQPQLKGFTVHQQAACNWSGAAAVLSRTVPPHSIVMMPVWYGPEVLWRSELRVIAGPYEMLPALADTATFVNGSEASAHAIMRGRGIGYALVCSADAGRGFGKELAGGKVPSWLARAPLDGAPPEFRLYRLVR